MSSPETRSANPSQPSSVPPSAAPRLWPGLVLVVLFWVFLIGLPRLDAAIAMTFLSSVAASALLTLLFSIWWLSNRRIAATNRLWGMASLIAGSIAALFVADPSVGGMGLILFGLPLALSAWIVALLVTKNRSPAIQRWTQAISVVAALATLTLVRVDGIDGSNNAALAWRWAPSAEDAYLAERGKGDAALPDARLDAPSADTSAPLVVHDGDWAEFRGPDRRGELHGVKIATNWNEAPPKQVWRQRIGPAWSSVLIIGQRLYTQEQRGEQETTVCLDAGTGRELWGHADAVRYSDGQAGAGPRATPTFANGQIFALGGTGILNCLDAATGQLQWSRNIATAAAATVPMWGFSSSPLVTDGLVVVFAGGEPKGLLAYRAADGEPAWTAPTGAVSYSSPQLATLAGTPQLLFFGERGLTAFDIATGTIRWNYESPGGAGWRVVQPRQLDDDSLLIGSEDLGLERLKFSSAEPQTPPESQWKTRAMRPAYNDFVSHDGCVYGFDEAIFCCIDAQTGKRRWKSGRYGHGQVLLLTDQPLLVITTEAGEAVLVAANPDKHEELGRFQAVKGKTWNHPVIAHGRLYVRNDEEIGCYEVGAEN